MKFKEICTVLQDLENTPSRLDKTKIVADFLKNNDEIQESILFLQGLVYPEWSDKKLGLSSKIVAKAIAFAYGIQNSVVEKNFKACGDLGLVAEKLSQTKTQQSLFSFDNNAKDESNLTLNEVFTTLQQMSEITGASTVDMKVAQIKKLLSSAKKSEAKFITRIIIGDLRVGVSTGTIRDAILKSIFPEIIGLNDKDVSKEMHTDKTILFINSVQDLEQEDIKKYDYIRAKDYETARQAYNFLSNIIQQGYDRVSDMGKVAEIAHKKGLQGVLQIDLEPMIPLRAMLMQKVATVEEATTKLDFPFALEYKYDGFRIQCHKKGDEVKLFTRNLEDVTNQFPDVVERVKKHIKAKSVILDGEILGIDQDGKFMAFQHISQRIKRKHNIHELVKKLPVSNAFWDVLYIDGESLLDEPLSKRRERLLEIIKTDKNIFVSEQIIINSVESGDVFYKKSLAEGNEGVVVKDLTSGYKPGNRVGCWLKLKPIMDPLDLVIVGAEWGEGKRATWLTSYIIACRDPLDDTKLYTIGKVGSGWKEKTSDKSSDTDVTFNEMTELLKPLIDTKENEKGKSISIRPRIVITVAYEELQTSPTYTSGYALRFPRFIGLREDLDMHGVDDLNKIKDYFNTQ